MEIMVKKLILFIIFSCPNLTFCQSRDSFVVDKVEKTPLPFANIKILNSDDGFYTNENGEFKLPEKFQGKLKISYFGYHELQIAHNELTDTIFLIPITEELDEIHINQKKLKEKTIGFIKKNKFLSWHIGSKTKFATFINSELCENTCYIKNIQIPIKKSTVENINGKFKEIFPKFNSAFKLSPL